MAVPMECRYTSFSDGREMSSVLLSPGGQVIRQVLELWSDDSDRIPRAKKGRSFGRSWSFGVMIPTESQEQRAAPVSLAQPQHLPQEEARFGRRYRPFICQSAIWPVAEVHRPQIVEKLVEVPKASSRSSADELGFAAVGQVQVEWSRHEQTGFMWLCDEHILRI